MTRFQHYKSGQVFGIRYAFDVKGDRIPRHQHDITHAHNVIVLKGAVDLVTQTGTQRLSPGVHDIEWQQPHEIIAAEDASEVLHLFLSGQPEGYDTLPESELRGTL